MADEDDTKAEVSAEKAYAAAVEAVPVKLESQPETPAAPEAVEPAPVESAQAEPAPPPVEFPAKAKRAAKPASTAPVVEVVPAVEKKLPLPKARKSPVKRAAPVKKPAKPAVSAKPQPVKKAPVKKAKRVVVKTAPKLAPKAASPKVPVKKLPTASQIKEKTMETTAEFTEGLQKVAADAQAKAKKAFEKSSAMFGEYAEFAKGNVEAFVESGKILATGVQKMGSDMIAEGKSAIETTTADVKQLAAVKSPSDFLKLQSDILRRNIDSALALTSKNGEAVLKLASESFAPISGRFSLAVEKLKKAA